MQKPQPKKNNNINDLIIISAAFLSLCVAVIVMLILVRREMTTARSHDHPDTATHRDAHINLREYKSPFDRLIEQNAAQSAAQSAEYHPKNNRYEANIDPTEEKIVREFREEKSAAQIMQAVARNHTPPTAPTVPYMINNGSPSLPLFALTFDGGSFANVAADILDTLASRNVKSTMFVTGEFIRRFPDVVRRIAAEGHELGNHTNRHPRLTTFASDRTQTTLPNVTPEFIANELAGAARVLAQHTGLRFAPLWRAPYGEYNREICRWAFDAGYRHIGWRQGRTWYQNLDTNDWVPNENSPGYRTPQEVYNKIIAIARQPGGLNGGIILMHLGTERKPRDQQVHFILGRLIDDLRALGYEAVTVSEMIDRRQQG